MSEERNWGKYHEYSPLTEEQKIECEMLAKQHYYRFNHIEFDELGLTVISEDQGGWPFEVAKIKIAASKELVIAACMSFIHVIHQHKNG